MTEISAAALNNEEIRKRFSDLQDSLRRQYKEVFPDRRAERTIVVLPSLTLDEDVLSQVSGVHFYEERMLCMLMLLQFPRSRVVFLSSHRIDQNIIDYYLHFMPGVPFHHARNRLTLLSCNDSSPRSLSEKILSRPRLIERIRDAIPDTQRAHMTCFNCTEHERKLSVNLGIPLYACDPDLLRWGSKTGSRKVFREAGLTLPDGFEDLRDDQDVMEALTNLKARNPEMNRAVVKLNEGFSGKANAVFSFVGAPTDTSLESWVRDRYATHLQFEAAEVTPEIYSEKLVAMGGIVEAFVEGETKTSPSVQCRITPQGDTEVISTHDQVLGGPSGQVFIGSRFPADKAYRAELQEAANSVSRVLLEKGVLGRFGIDFVSVKSRDGWEHYAIEINLRKGGTTHSFMMLEFLSDGSYNPETGRFLTSAGQPRYYYSSDNIEKESYKGLLPSDLVDIAVMNRIHFHGATQQGVAFHLIGALSEFGKLGMVCIADSHEKAQEMHAVTLSVLDKEAPSDEK